VSIEGLFSSKTGLSPSTYVTSLTHFHCRIRRFFFLTLPQSVHPIRCTTPNF
jgi:hypothetical protein